MAQLKAKIEGGELDLPPDFPSDKVYQTWKDVLYEKPTHPFTVLFVKMILNHFCFAPLRSYQKAL